ncbi:MAG: sugar phosphate isomerase/epimerase [Clostridia bacterium]|nr:sugar phosphate isomerase/epimerase [Clostridia bacterium]
MKTGVSTASLFMRVNNERALGALNRLGVTKAEVFLTSFSEYSEEFARQMLTDKGNVEVFSVHVLNSQIEPQLFSEHERVLSDSYFWLGKAMEAARVLGASHYTFHGTARFKKSSRDPRNDRFPRIGKRLKEIYDFCQGFGVTLCLENVEWSIYNRPEVFSKMLPFVPNLKGVLDIKQARISGYDYREYLEEMGGRIACVHISDLDERGKMCLPGRGAFDFDTLVKRLQGVGFDGNLFIEAYKDDFSAEDELRASVEYVDEILYKNNCLR